MNSHAYSGLQEPIMNQTSSELSFLNHVNGFCSRFFQKQSVVNYDRKRGSWCESEGSISKYLGGDFEVIEVLGKGGDTDAG